MKCFRCEGEGKVVTEEWDREWDRFSHNAPSNYDTKRHMERSGITKYKSCPVCNGLKVLTNVKLDDLNGKNARVIEVSREGVSLIDFVLIKFDDDTFAKVLIKDLEIGKR
ncbi:hypothetical protein [Bacillus sp. FJAT-26390]|uniref:hypothetical protein n=1 Tax=Bacillus sp. FJAT-26390 TaxID=1743142 RepID=UPI0008080E21|nr:hypothetical protein [Bacillus sp. FJAT-26390]OBZ08061.1 hypothetical protein A7975_27440 [Bacillus sp. FJAT-26390]